MKGYILELVKESMNQLAPSEAEAVFASSVLDVSYPRPGFGDYATNAAMVTFKKFQDSPATSPMEFASRLAEAIQSVDGGKTFSKVEAVSGFINLTLSEEFLISGIQKILNQKETFGSSDIGSGRKVVFEYFQNNIAKPPHVGHLRSAVIGDSLVRIFKSLGYQTVTDTHIGDWGTQFGILLYAYKTMGDKSAVEQDPIQELNKLYVAMSAKIEQQPELRDLGKAEFKKLEDGDAENRELWKWFIRVSMEDFERYRSMLGLLEFDHNLGESFYEDKMQSVLDELSSRNLITVGDDGEQYVDLEADGLGRCILVKSDGATLYHLRDLATYIYRKREWDFYRNNYVVDVRQSHHFRQLFRILGMMGYPAETDSRHIDFGFMSLPEGAISTRKGTVISLENLMGEAEKRALEIINVKNPELVNKEAAAKKVALSAIKYFDLSHNRTTEIVFSWDKAISFEGNTGPYLQYTHARIHGIMRKGGIEHSSVSMPNESIGFTEHELVVMRKLHQFPEIVGICADDYTPNLLCNYLFELSQNFNSFYQAVPVLQEQDEQKRAARLAIITATAQVIRNGLYLLGIEAPEEM